MTTDPIADPTWCGARMGANKISNNNTFFHYFSLIHFSHITINMITDPIADMLTRIRNAQLVKKAEVVLPYSKIKYNIAKILAENGWLGQIEVIEPEISKVNKKVKIEKNLKFRQLKLGLKYEENKPKISSLTRISKPGRRVYVARDEIKPVLNNYGISIISTSKGLMTNKQARVAGLGGEIICEVY